MVGDNIGRTVGLNGEKLGLADGLEEPETLVGLWLKLGLHVGDLVGGFEGAEGAMLTGVPVGIKLGFTDETEPAESTKLGNRYTSPKPEAQPMNMATEPEAGMTN